MRKAGWDLCASGEKGGGALACLVLYFFFSIFWSKQLKSFDLFVFLGLKRLWL